MTFLVGLVFLAVSCQIFSISFCNSVEISINCGKIRGSTLTTRGGREVCSFKGIPYAEPPVGYLRFKEPVPATPWKYLRNAMEDRPPCPQLKNGKPVGEEDCLYLNVYTPRCSNLRSAEKLPVLVFIHGGKWEAGTADSRTSGPEFLLDKNIVLVVISFRIGALGFLSTGDYVVPGNWGLKDQVMALKWVQANIRNFGGDPGRVTIMGESKGGSAVHALMFSPQSRGLFERGISFSGVFHNPYAFAPVVNVTTPSKKLAKLLECPTEPSVKLLDCMRTKDFKKFLELQSQLYPNSIVPPGVDTLWAPIIESNSSNPLISFDPKNSPWRPKYPWMNGVNAADGGSYVAYMFGVGPNFEAFLKLLKENPRLVLPLVLQLDLEFCRKDIPTVIDRILKFYFGDRPVDETSKVPLVNLFSDYFFFTMAVNESLNHGGPVHFFEYAYNQSVSFNMLRGDKSLKVAPTHTDVLLNIFPDPADFPSRNYTEKDIEVSKKVVDIIAAFVQNKDLSRSTGVKWDSIGTEDNMKYLYMGNEFVQKKNFLPERLKFWKDLRAEFRTKSLADSQIC